MTSTLVTNPPAAWHWAVGCGAALGVQVEQAPHLLAQAAATSHLLLAVHGVLEQLPNLQDVCLHAQG